MIDTMMVLWTSGMWKRLLRNIVALLLLFLGICVLLFLLTTSGSRWSSLAVTVTRSNAPAQSNVAGQVGSSAAPTTIQPTPAPTAMPSTKPYIEPIILQNPILPDRHANQREYKHFSHRHPFSYPPSTQPATPEAPPDNGFQDSSNPLQNLP
ncbi:MAG TPA: hypothetical protein VGM01_00340 [Ktedonobacteraceae bacterium]